MLNIKYPLAQKRQSKTIIHDQEIIDNYAWLRDKKWPKVDNEEILNYLREENKYSKNYFDRFKDLQDKVYQEMIGRIKLSDKSTPIKRRDYYHYVQTSEHDQYSTHIRIDKNGKEEILFDENKESEGHEFFQTGCLSISPNEKLLAYSTDKKGDEHYTLKIRDLKSGEDFHDQIDNIIGRVVWKSDNQGFYYTKLDDKWRPNKIYYHTLGTGQDDDILVYEEKDITFRSYVTKSTDEEHIFICINSSNSCEVRTINSDHQQHLLLERKKDRLFSVEHFQNHFYIQLNDTGKNFRLVRVSDNKKFSPDNYQEIIPHALDEYLLDFILFNDHLVVSKKISGLTNVIIYDHHNNKLDQISFPDPAYSADAIKSWYDDDGVIISYSSMRTPRSTMKYIFEDRRLITLKEQEIPSGYDKNDYTVERVFVKSRDQKTNVPVSILYKKSLFKNDGSNPLLLYGYGSYGYAVPPSFNTNIFSLVDRGFVYAIAHIRGGDDLGFEWYESAKFLNKKKTFEDFVDIINFFSNGKYSSAKKISILGGSAGGMLVGVALNEAANIIHSAIAAVPFVDVLNTMLDETLPLTPGEFEEWGNPKDKHFFDYIKSYSPYDNIKKQEYPHIFVSAGLNDPRVTYWEPAKYVAKLREKKTDKNLLLLDTKMEAGHQGKTGRFEQYKEKAKEFVFFLTTHKITK